MLSVLSFSEAGGHPVNEDAFVVRPHPDDDRCLLVALADGQGGQAGGARAAELACRSAIDGAAGFPAASVAISAYWPTVLRLADQAVRADEQAGYTTLIGLAIRGNTVVGASSGDSMVMTVGTGRTSELTRAQQQNPPVGSGGAFFVPFEAELIAPWLILVVSDGVWKYVGWDRLRDLALRNRGQALIDALQQAARLPGSGQFQDDFTVVVIQDCE
jgi:serine/threonine protein phosphatase PrpC